MEASSATQTFLGDEPGRSAVRVELSDVQGLWGGRRIAAERGKAVLRLIGRGMSERRFEITLPQAEWDKLLDAFIVNDFLTIEPADRMGIPDEARPRITLVNTVGERHSVEKWAGVKDARFEAVYAAITGLERLTQGIEPVYSGSYMP